MLKRKLGELGEQIAFNYLKKLGYRFVDKNFHCTFGEIDLIFKEKDCLIFVEVKTRIGTSRGTGAEAITKKKVRSIQLTSEYFIKLRREKEPLQRIDVIAILMSSDEKVLDLRHIKNITG